MQQYHSLSKKQIFGGLGIYFAIRLFSYFFSPSTPLYAANPINWAASVGILLLTFYFLLRRDERGWLIIAAEIILGGAGSFLEIKGISLRTLLLITSMAIFLYQQYPTLYPSPKRGGTRKGVFIFYLFLLIFLTVAISVFQGWRFGHATGAIIADTIPYLFFLYYFPLKQLLSSEQNRQILFGMLIAAIIGNFIFIYFTLSGFSSGLFTLQDSYYHWFRDVAGGKITDYGTGFFRILLNEQLLLVPIFLWIFGKTVSSPPFQEPVLSLSKEGAGGGLPSIASVPQATATPFSLPLGKGEMTTAFAMTGALLAILTINITRIYLVALAIGILFLFSVKNWKRWLTYSAAAFIFFITAFTLTHLAATKGKSFGWEYLGLRLQSIAMPQTEDSSLSRLLLLPKILEKIKLHPLLGNGLGDMVTVYSPIFKQNITTPHFDWGYLEIIAEMGIIGLMAWILVIGYLILKITTAHGGVPHHGGKNNKTALAALIGLLVINITSPALFHVLGVILIVYLLSAHIVCSNNNSNSKN